MFNCPQKEVCPICNSNCIKHFNPTLIQNYERKEFECGTIIDNYGIMLFEIKKCNQDLKKNESGIDKT